VKSSQFAIAGSTPMTFQLVARSVSSSAWSNSLCCPECEVSLNLHQPDEDQPSQLLGTCDCCSRWFFLVENELDCEDMLVFELPTAEEIRAALVGPCAARAGKPDRTKCS
jgi:hypothetical protein